jgi:AbrB family looped-hinge helix DNA binding protein
MVFTTLSSKGQVILPKSVRNSRHWLAGTKFVVETTDDGVLLRPVKATASRLTDVAGCLKSAHPAHTIAEMNQAIDDEISARNDRGRY